MGVLRTDRRFKPPTMSPLEKASVTANVSYRGDLSPQTILRVLTGEMAVPREFEAHFRELLDDAPVSLLAEVAHEIQQVRAVPMKKTWRRMRQLAIELSCTRGIWNETSRHEQAGDMEEACGYLDELSGGRAVREARAPGRRN